MSRRNRSVLPPLDPPAADVMLTGDEHTLAAQNGLATRLPKGDDPEQVAQRMRDRRERIAARRAGEVEP